eukprot:CAMPEP_0116124584 /NCGR_PEP_ID=MMETSP0329-20121206/5355_1 /TAXON_ID=697910 /ORGANISM="Pseudo-nitzschia arenysensis, Strain B593" /LENGTH=175 /DNA_ID=CAMNT_0003618567 /DNA_START=115 /DNA_END=642 /DNA_ORIENTATION=+
MENGYSAQYYQQQNHHRLQPLSMPSQPPPPVMWEQQYPSRLYPTSSSNSSSSMKRGRVSSEESSGSIPSLTCHTATQPAVRISNCDEPSPQVPISTTPKKARSNNYRAPQSVKPSLLTAMGTLAGGTTSKNVIQGSIAASVPIRRRLSGGHLEQYVGGHEKAVDNDPNRPRSMSF